MGRFGLIVLMSALLALVGCSSAGNNITDSGTPAADAIAGSDASPLTGLSPEAAMAAVPDRTVATV